MATLYTNGDYIVLTPAAFATYSLIRYSAAQPTQSVMLGLSVSGTINFASRLGSVSAMIDGWTGNDNITSGSGNDSLWGNSGNDTLTGGLGDDFLVGDWDDGVAAGNDVLYGGDGEDILVAGLGNDGLYGGNGDDVLVLADRLIGAVTLSGGAGVDVALLSDAFNSGMDAIAVSRLVLNSTASIDFFDAGSINLTGTAGNDLIDLSGTLAFRWGNYFQTEFAIDLRGGNDTFTGGASNEFVSILAGGDRITMGDGDDELSIVGGSMAGVTISGGAGYDRLILKDRPLVTDGSPTTLAVTSFAFLTSSLFEEIHVDQSLQLTGTEAADTLSMVGVPELFLAKPIALLGGNDRFTAGFGIAVDGGAGNDTLIGSAGYDDLDGGTGNDSMSGGLSDDRYHVDTVNDVIVELANQGDDTVLTSLSSFTLGANLERLAALGNGGLFGTGNAANNRMNGAGGRDHFLGLDGADELDGGDGIDTLEGGHGDDSYWADRSDVLIEAAGGGIDQIITSNRSWTLARNFERLSHDSSVDFAGTGNEQANVILGNSGDDTLVGLLGNDTIFGAAGNDILDGGEGQDLLSGGQGDDRYVSVSGDTVYEYANEGIDTLITLDNVATLSGAIENIYADRGLAWANFTGNGLDNVLKGSAGNDILNGMDGDDTLRGGGGVDHLIGGDGGDTYYIDAGDQVSGIDEVPWSGDNDRIISALRKTIMVTGIETLELTARNGATGVGTDRDNWLFGGRGNDELLGKGGIDHINGGQGADTMVGGEDSDYYYVDNLLDQIVERSAEGDDTAFVTVSGYQVARWVEYITIGSDLGLSVYGGSAGSRFVGGAGNDSLYGGLGNDRLDGQAGTDLLVGGGGNDSYLALTPDDTIIEEADGGFDDVSVSGDAYVLAENLEVAFLFGGSSAYLEGNSADNNLSAYGDAVTMLGGEGNDTFEFRAPVAELFGGSGDDAYYLVPLSGAPGTWTIVEEVNGGLDKIVTSVDMTLPENVEILVLDWASNAATGTGNGSDNVIVGNIEADRLYGLGGNDTLVGSEYDRMEGGDGADTYVIEIGFFPSSPCKVAGFVSGSDQVILNFYYGLGSSTSGPLPATAFRVIKTGGYYDYDDRIIYDKDQGILYMDEDGALPFYTLHEVARFAGKPTLTAADISILVEPWTL